MRGAAGGRAAVVPQALGCPDGPGWDFGGFRLKTVWAAIYHDHAECIFRPTG